MKTQFQKKDSDSEKIYQEMTRDALGFYQDQNSKYTGKSLESEFSDQLDGLTESKYNPFKQKLLNTLTAELQVILPGAFQIIPQSTQCLSYANLHSWSPSRAYFSIFEMKKSEYIWILHFSRTVGEVLAYLIHKENFKTEINLYEGLDEADSLIYLEIGEMLRKLFWSILKLWPKNQNLNVSRCRHILQLGFQKEILLKEKYIIFPFYLKNKDCSGEFNLIFPRKYIYNFGI